MRDGGSPIDDTIIGLFDAFRHLLAIDDDSGPLLPLISNFPPGGGHVLLASSPADAAATGTYQRS